MHKAFLSGALALSLFAASDAVAQNLRGSQQKIERVYRQALSHDLTFFQTSASVRQAAQRGTLVRMSGNADYTLHQVSYPYLLPAAATFVERLAAQYRAACGERLVITSATRPASMRLPNSIDRSVHPTGMAVDLRRPANARCLSWLRQTLSGLEARGVIDATEETRPPHFHVAVFPAPYERYVAQLTGAPRLASAAPARESESARRSPASASAESPSAPATVRATPAPAASTRVAAAAPPTAETHVSEERPSARPPLLATRAEPARTYQVRAGESLWAIAQKLDVSVDLIKAVNALASADLLAGQILIIPAGH